jgi:cation diffusion facilitator CzcD-associated flavoprotein CzcO
MREPPRLRPDPVIDWRASAPRGTRSSTICGGSRASSESTALVVPRTEVTACRWDEETLRWTVESADGRTWEAEALVVATGQLHRPAYPGVEGRESFAGRSFHSAEWDLGHDLRGKRVAVIGTGASAVQFVPEVAAQAERLVVFQRTIGSCRARTDRTPGS